MTGYVATVVVVVLFAWVVIRVTAAIEEGGRRVDVAFAVCLDPMPDTTEAEADLFWDTWQPDVVNAQTLPLSQSPTAQRIRELIADNECARLRDELDQWGRPA